MANTSLVRGLKVVGHIYGSDYSARVRKYIVPSGDATALFIGDAVKSGGTAVALGDEVLTTVIQAAAGDTLRGVVVGIDPIEGVAVGSENLNRLHRPASTQMVVHVCDDPNAIFEIQEDAVGATTALVDVGENADLIVGAGSTTTGLSGMQLDSSDHKTATAQLRILGFAPIIGNQAAVANAKLLVMINEHELKSTSGV
jgi:hypothetical protein